MTLGARQRAEEEDEAEEEEEEGSRVMSPVQACPPQETLPEEELSCCRGGSINTVCDGTTDCVLNVGEGGFWFFQRESFFILILLFSGTFATLCVLGKSDSSNFLKKKEKKITF